jgi:hypothetical protein
MARNPQHRDIPIGKLRSFVPTKPREMVSMDILYFPQSSKGYTHGLIISDMFSLYLSFFPLKSKSSSQVAQALRSYISLQGTPQVIYSDNDPSFQDEVKEVMTTYNIKHATSFPYSQQQNSVEAQVRNFKNAYRAAILSSEIFSHPQWHVLYPLVIIRINSMITKYGLSRENIHFQDMLENQLPIITDVSINNNIDDDLNEVSKNFRSKILKFLHNKQKAKDSYKNGKKFKFLTHELVMRKQYNPASMLHPTFVGPYRIMQLHGLGALIKDPRNGDIFSVHYENLRKINLEEFLQILPTNFDHEILQNIGFNRYNKKGTPDYIKSAQEKIDDNYIDPNPNNLEKPEFIDEHNYKKLRSGKKISVNLSKISRSTNINIDSAKFCSENIPRTQQTTRNGILRKSILINPTPYAIIDQTEINGIWCFKSQLDETIANKIQFKYKRKYASSFSSPEKGTLTIQLTEQNSPKKVKFSTITVHFY